MKTREATAEDIEARAFLEWMLADHFTFLGHATMRSCRTAPVSALRGIEGSGFGILRESLRSPARPRDPAAGRRGHHLRRIAIFSDEGEFARHRASARLSRLRRREARGATAR
ncbi:hypothetical protein [Burkholderia multivorans]|uniref:hypothetical protein n=1 Tax=Burkholderia multivorans TaxID=87883 RepID=UPI003EC086AF